MALKRKKYSLNPYSILSLLGDMGGLLDIAWAIGILLTTSEVTKAFERSLLKETYQVQDYDKDNSELYVSETARINFAKYGGIDYDLSKIKATENDDEEP